MDLSSAFIPTILTYSPTTASTGVGTLPNIDITFSRDMDTAQFTASETLNTLFSLVELSTDASYDLSYSNYDSDSFILTLVPATALIPGETYQVLARQTIQSSTGRTLPRNYTWDFTVNGSTLGMPTLIFPQNETIHSAMPTLSWSSVASASSYDLVISTTPRFSTAVLSVNVPTSTTYSPNSSAFTVNTEYFWRVRAAAATTTGAWSTGITSFYYGAFTPTAYDSRLTTPYEGLFGVIAVTPPDGTTNLAAWPTMLVSFSNSIVASSATSSTVYLYYEPSDGDPAVLPGYLNGGITIASSSIVFTPSGDISENMRYTLNIVSIQSSNGTQLDSLYQVYFTGKYNPLYADVLSIRAMCGLFVATFTDDLINTHIHQASIDCNRTQDLASDTTLTTLKTSISNVTYDMIRYVRAKAAFSLLQLRYFEMLEEADTRKTLGDFTVDIGAGSITELGKLLTKYGAEVERLENVIRDDRVLPEVGTRSSQWNRDERLSDTSLAGLFRKTF